MLALNDCASLNQLYHLIKDRLIQRMEELTNKEPTYSDFRAGNVLHSQADISKVQHLLGSQQRHKNSDGLDEMLDWNVYSLR